MVDLRKCLKCGCSLFSAERFCSACRSALDTGYEELTEEYHQSQDSLWRLKHGEERASAHTPSNS